MQLEELEEKKEIELSNAEKEQLFNSIVRGKDCTEEIETSKGKFKIKFPRIRDLEIIGRLLASKTNGLPVNSFDIGTYTLMNQVATLDVLVISGAPWFENAKKDNKNFSWGMIPDQNFIGEVYEKVFRFRNETQKLFEQNKDDGSDRVVVSDDTKDSYTPDLFDGISN